MSMQKAIIISFRFIGDGVSDTVVVDLLADPYFVGTAPEIENWFASDRKASAPVGVIVSSAGATASLAGNILTVTVSPVPASGSNNEFDGFLLFA